jgi:hypothetical protein
LLSIIGEDSGGIERMRNQREGKHLSETKNASLLNQDEIGTIQAPNREKCNIYCESWCIMVVNNENEQEEEENKEAGFFWKKLGREMVEFDENK